MSKFIDGLEKVLLPVAVKLGKQPHINAIKNGFIKLMPLTLAGAMFVLINNVFLSFGQGSFFYSMGVRLDPETIGILDGFKVVGDNVIHGTLGIMSLMTPFFVGMSLCEERKVDPIAGGLLAIASFVTVTPFHVMNGADIVNGVIDANWIGGANVISGIIVGLLVAEIFAFVIRRNWVIKLPDTVPESVARSFSALIPGFIILLMMGVVSGLLIHWETNFHQVIMESISKPLTAMDGLVGWVYAIFSSLLWFFGIHGALALSALDAGIMTPWGLENVATFTDYGSVDAAIAAGKSFHFWTKPMFDSYVLLGGTGATLGLIIAIFIGSRRTDYRQIAKLGLPSGLFQINEPILFGLPIIMNPIMFIPYVAIQPILIVITLTAFNLGFIPPTTNMAPWTMPTGLGAFFNTNGSISAMVLALFNLGVSVVVYLPFVIISNKAQSNIEEEKEETEEDIMNALKF